MVALICIKITTGDQQPVVTSATSNTHYHPPAVPTSHIQSSYKWVEGLTYLHLLCGAKLCMNWSYCLLDRDSCNISPAVLKASYLFIILATNGLVAKMCALWVNGSGFNPHPQSVMVYHLLVVVPCPGRNVLW